MSEQEIKDMREELEYFSSSELKNDNPELYQDKDFRNYCKRLLKASDEELSSEKIQKEYDQRYEAARRKSFVLYESKKCKDKEIREYASGLLLSSDGNITRQQYEELQEKVALYQNKRIEKKMEAAYKRLKRKEATGELSEREEERLEELEAELPIEFVKKVEEKIDNESILLS